MGRSTRGTVSALLVLGVMLVTAGSAPGAARTSGSERFDGGLVVSGASGQRQAVGSAIAMSGVFNGVGRIVERPNRPGDSSKVSRDDLVFADGTLHIVNTSGHATFSANRRTCTVKFNVEKSTTVEGGAGRFAGASGRFTGTVSGTGVARRTAGGSCDQQHVALVEIDTVTATGTLSF